MILKSKLGALMVIILRSNMSSITVVWLGAMHCKGVGKNGSYDFCQVKFMNTIENVQKENRRVLAYGCEESVLDLDSNALDQFKQFTPGQEVDLIIGPNPRNLNRNICTGAKAKA